MATTEINIVARNRAAAALRQVNTQLGAIQGATQNVNAGMGRLRNLVLGVAAALGGIRVAKGFLDTEGHQENEIKDMKTIAYPKLIPYLVDTIQVMEKRIKELEKKVK